MFNAGLYLTNSFVAKFVGAGYAMLPHETVANHRAVLGLFMIIAAFQIFTAMLLMHGVAGFAPLPDRCDAPGDWPRRSAAPQCQDVVA